MHACLISGLIEPISPMKGGTPEMLEAIGGSGVSTVNQAIVNVINQLQAQTDASIQAVATGDAATVNISAAAYAQQAAADN
jgi:intracellular sulfur oxidation DsrE/DsrF family protein